MLQVCENSIILISSPEKNANNTVCKSAITTRNCTHMCRCSHCNSQLPVAKGKKKTSLCCHNFQSLTFAGNTSLFFPPITWPPKTSKSALLLQVTVSFFFTRHMASKNLQKHVTFASNFFWLISGDKGFCSAKKHVACKSNIFFRGSGRSCDWHEKRDMLLAKQHFVGI